MIRTHTITLHVVRCDGCGTQNRIVADGFSSEELAERDAHAHGWFVDFDDTHLCPTCAAEPCS